MIDEKWRNFVGVKHGSLAIDETAMLVRQEAAMIGFNPDLKVVISERFMDDSALLFKKDANPVRITGKITISF